MKFFTVGPAELFPTCQKHFEEGFQQQIGSMSHRSEAFRNIYQHTDEQLRMLLNIPSSHRVFFTSSASEIWERMLLNLVKEKSFHFIQGAFSRKFHEYALKIQKKPYVFEVQDGQGFDDLSNVIIPDDCELICFTQNETSSGIRIQEDMIQGIKKRNPGKLVCCDIVSAVPYIDFDFSFIDSAFFSVQKGMGLPPGLGVWIVNEACIQKAAYMESFGENIGAHFTLSAFEKNYKNFETPSTPNTMAIYVLGKVAEDMNNYGKALVRKETEDKFDLLYDFIRSHPQLSFKSNSKETLSRTTVVADSVIPAKEWNHVLKPQNMQIAGGYGSYKDTQIRIANFPSSTIEEMALLIDSMLIR